MAVVVAAILVIISLLEVVSSQSSGDVRLVGQSNANLGRLEIFWNGQWSTFCGAEQNSFTRGAAQAACRQLGYLDLLRFDTVTKLNFSKAGDGVPIAFGQADCEYNFASGALHILRCSVSTTVPSSCSHSDDIGVVCEPVSLWRHPYNTQVRLRPSASPASTSSGVVEIYLSDQWGNVCYSDSGFDSSAADSVCRQMGYTNAETHQQSSSASTDTVWLKELQCGKKVHECTNCCFEVSASPSPVSCDSNSFVQVQCAFDISKKGDASAGSQAVCSVGCPSGSPSSSAVVAIVVVVLILLVVTVLLVLLGVCCLLPSCYLFKWRKEKLSGYSSNF